MRIDHVSFRQSPTPHPGEPVDSVVIIVDDDPSVRNALAELIRTDGLCPVVFASTHELLESDALDRPGCLVLDVRLPGVSGLDLQAHLASCGVQKPIIFLTGFGDVPMSVQAMKAGALDFLTKPVRDQTLLDAVHTALAADARQRAAENERRRIASLYGTLTARERQVLQSVATGKLNKQIAFELGLAESTVKIHRSSMMRKMKVTSLSRLLDGWRVLAFTQDHTGREPGNASSTT